MKTEEEKNQSDKEKTAPPGDNKNGAGEDWRKKDAAPPLEWAMAVVGLILVAATIGFLIYQAFAGKRSPPDITVRADSITTVRDGYLVRFRATNHGELTAAAVTVEGELKDQTGGSVETSSAAVRYAPSGSEVTGGIYFSRDPREFDLQLRAKGYEEP